MRIHAALGLTGVAVAVLLHVTLTEAAVLLIVAGMVVVAEMVNTVMEEFLDIVHPDHHEAVRRIKDVLAGAVLLAAVLAVLVGVLILGPHLVDLAT